MVKISFLCVCLTRIIFTIRDNQGSIVARTVTNPILISDDNKEIKLSEDGSLSAGMSSAGRAPSNAENPFGFSATDQSSLSMEDSSDVSSSSLKRRRESDWSGSIRVQPLTSITPTPVNNNKGQFSSPSYNRPTTSASVKVEVLSPSATSPDAPISSSSRVPSTTSMSPNVSNTGVVLPQIQRVIPSQGSVRGGIEVTLLGTGFQSGLIASFGDVRASYTQCWSDSTIVTQLPPSATTGPVIVSFEGYTHSMPQIFTYVDDTDRQLIELALQVVGLKMSGKLEDARNIAMRIVGSKDQDRNSNSQSGKAEGSTHDFSGFSTTSNNPHENVILRCIEVAVIEEGLPNWQVRNSEGQTMLHLAAALGYSKIIVALLSQGARVDLQDVNGMTPLHFAALNGHRLVIQQLLRCQSNPFNRTFAGFTVMDIAQDYVEDLLPIGMRYREYQEMIKEARSSSSSTLSSMMSVNENIRPLTSYSGGGLERSASGISLLHSYEYTDEEWGFSSSSESEEDLLGDVRSAMRAVRPSSRSGGDEVQFVEHLNHGVDGSNPDLGVRVSNAAENVSKYISQLTINAKNKMHWDNWDDVFNYLYKRRETSRHILIDTTDSGSSPETIHPGASDSDATVAPPEVGKSPQVFWKRYFKPPPPRYDDLFPDQKSDGNTSKVSLLPTSTEQPQHQQQDLLDDQQVDEQASYEQQFLQIFFNNRKQLRNDRMLFFFWLPVLLTILMIFGLRIAGYSPGEYFSDFGNRIREIASYMFLGKKGTLPCSTSQRTTLISV